MAPPIESEENVRLDKIDIKGFRSCMSTSFSPHPELSALIGRNGAGKTNILHAIRLLRGTPGRHRYVNLSEETSADAEVTAWFRVNALEPIGLKMRFSNLESSRRADELVAISTTWNLSAITGKRAWRNLPPTEFFQGGLHTRYYANEVLLFDKESSVGRVRKQDLERSGIDLLQNKQVAEAVSAIANFQSGIKYYSAAQFTNPARCPSSFEVDEEGRLTESFGPVIAHLKFLYDLYLLKSANPELYENYTGFVSRQQLGLISRIIWKEIELSSSTAEVRNGGGVKKVRKRKTLVIPKVQIGSSYITFNQLSEGTFKTLALAFYIITDSSRLLMVEEPEVCVHHGLLSKIIDTLKSYSKVKQTIISTHSDLLVDELDTQNIFVAEMIRSGTRVRQLDDALSKNGREALHAYLAESGSLGEYWRSGGLS